MDAPLGGNRAVLEGPEAHHLAHVLRAAVGDEVTLFDGHGDEFLARVARLGRQRVELDVLARRHADRESPVELTLAVALPKGDRQKWLVEKAVELGVARLIPLRTARGVAQPDPRTIHRLARHVIEAAKQCGRNRLMEVAEPRDWADLAAAPADAAPRLLAHPCEQPLRDALPDPLPRAMLAAVGPEGGFTEDEVAQAARAGWLVVDLGPRILRIETAALALAAQLIG